MLTDLENIAVFDETEKRVSFKIAAIRVLIHNSMAQFLSFDFNKMILLLVKTRVYQYREFTAKKKGLMDFK